MGDHGVLVGIYISVAGHVILWSTIMRGNIVVVGLAARSSSTANVIYGGCDCRDIFEEYHDSSVYRNPTHFTTVPQVIHEVHCKSYIECG